MLRKRGGGKPTGGRRSGEASRSTRPPSIATVSDVIGRKRRDVTKNGVRLEGSLTRSELQPVAYLWGPLNRGREAKRETEIMRHLLESDSNQSPERGEMECDRAGWGGEGRYGMGREGTERDGRVGAGSSSQLSLCVGLYRSLKTPWQGIAHPTSQLLDVEL
ncbi:hypothetical protein E2C01_020051 [Portunus trituberculatus]|uniref:Uncharacterized protein n=1 Tax=Portunus trituberculatus TaxID=210409 RepID=A0A5B7DZ66_PORTR|nr:hypothetical protein [Portunus trituberculatus]